MSPDPLSAAKAHAMPSGRLGSRLWLAGKLAAAIGLYACFAAGLLKLSYVSDLIASIGAALLLLAAALFDSGYGESGGTREARTSVRAILSSQAFRWLFKRLPAGMPGRGIAGGYQPCLSALLLGLSALAGAYQAIRGGGGAAPRPELGVAFATLSALLALMLIVMERYMASLPVARLVHAPALARMLRAPIAVCAIGAVVTFAVSSGHPWARIVLQLTSCGVGIVAVEIVARAVLGWYDPLRHGAPVPGAVPKPLVDSVLIGWLTPGASPWRAICDYSAAKFDIDLRQSRGVRFILRAAPGFLMLSALLAYALSAVTELQPNQRGIEERFGRPVRVLEPGLHVGLPWPFGQVVPVENGVLHEIAVIAPASAADASAQGGDALPYHPDTPGAIDAPPPDSANRLWDNTHVFDTTQLIAGQSNDQESFQIMNVDARFVYRIGASDQDALAASYQVADLPALIRDLAGRALIRHFSTETLAAILGEPQDQMARALKASLQGDLDRLHSGIEIVAVVIEAIHPPGGAANAYHNVQAAELEAQALIFAEQGRASQTLNEAQQTAAVSLNNATAGAAQIMADAHATTLGFDAALAAYRSAGNIFLRETYLHALAKGLSQAQLTILDHRVADSSRATIDLRDYARGHPDLTGALRDSRSTSAN
jgi:regulator of protease activity HflC (stomatin/prohibitin superfamily)